MDIWQNFADYLRKSDCKELSVVWNSSVKNLIYLQFFKYIILC